METSHYKITRLTTLFLLLAFLTIGLVGCDPKEAPPRAASGIGSVGIIDYLEVQNRVGIADQNREKLQSFDQTRDKALAELLVALREQAKPLENQISTEKDQEKVAKIRNTLQQLNQHYFTAQQQWAQKRDQYVRSMGNAIIQALEPAMQAVCDQHGLKIIMIKGDREGYVSPDVEMTDEVIDEWKRNPVNPIYNDTSSENPQSERTQSESFQFPEIGK